MTATPQHCAPGAATPGAVPRGESTPAWRLLVTLAIAGALSGWLVVSGRAVFGVLLVAVVLGLVAVLITGVVGAFASFG